MDLYTKVGLYRHICTAPVGYPQIKKIFQVKTIAISKFLSFLFSFSLQRLCRDLQIW